MRNQILMLCLAVPVSCFGQRYADAPFYYPVAGIPSAAYVEGWQHGSTKANDVLIDLSVMASTPDMEGIYGWSVHSWVDRHQQEHIFHYFVQYDDPNVIFGYDLHVEPVKGTDEVRCTFSPLTDPEELKQYPNAWVRDVTIPVVAFDGELKPVVVKSGGVLAFTVLPEDEGHTSVIHYIRLTRTDQTAVAAVDDTGGR